MGLDFYLEVTEPHDVFGRNITHNLGAMAAEAGIYKVLWRPEEIGVTTASQAIPILEAGLALLKSDRPRFEQFNAPNGWGMYEHFVPFVQEVLAACKEYPKAIIRISR